MDALPFQLFPQITPWHGQTSLRIIVCQENAFLNASLNVLAGWKLYEVYPALWSSWPGNAIVTPLHRALWHLGNWIWYSWYMICTAALKTQLLLFRSRQRLLMGTGISHGSDWGFFFSPTSHWSLNTQSLVEKMACMIFMNEIPAALLAIETHKKVFLCVFIFHFSKKPIKDLWQMLWSYIQGCTLKDIHFRVSLQDVLLCFVAKVDHRLKHFVEIKHKVIGSDFNWRPSRPHSACQRYPMWSAEFRILLFSNFILSSAWPTVKPPSSQTGLPRELTATH